MLVPIDHDADDELIKALGSPGNDIEMTVGDGVKAAGIDGNTHGIHPLRKSVIHVFP